MSNTITTIPLPEEPAAKKFVQMACRAIVRDNYDPFPVSEELSTISEPQTKVLQQILAYFHERVTAAKFQQTAAELWLKKARTFGIEYAKLNDFVENLGMRAAFAVQRDRDAKQWVGIPELQSEVAGRIAELYKALKAVKQAEFEKRRFPVDEQSDSIGG